MSGINNFPRPKSLHVSETRAASGFTASMRPLRKLLRSVFVGRKPRPRKKTIDASFANAQAIETFIGPGSILDGDLIFTGGLRIEGTIYGNVEAKDRNGALVICNKAKVFGNVRAAYLIVNGNVQGNVQCDESLSLESNAVISGDVRYYEINMSLGSCVNGELVPQLKSQRP